MTMGVAMQMQWQLRQLMQKHGIAPEPCIVPLTVPVAHPMTLDGLASTTDLDLDRVRFRRYACCHGKSRYHCSGNMNPAQVAGQIERLNYDDHVNLRIRCTVTHELAR
jgi:hypothetical protein